MLTQDPDPALVEALAKRHEKPYEEEDKQEGEKVFQPSEAKALKIKQEALVEPIALRRWAPRRLMRR